MAFAENMRCLREQNRLSQTELAERVGVTQAAIARFESGRIVPNVVTAVKIARKLDTTVEELVNGDNTFDKVNEQEEI